MRLERDEKAAVTDYIMNRLGVGYDYACKMIDGCQSVAELNDLFTVKANEQATRPAVQEFIPSKNEKEIDTMKIEINGKITLEAQLTDQAMLTEVVKDSFNLIRELNGLPTVQQMTFPIFEKKDEDTTTIPSAAAFDRNLETLKSNVKEMRPITPEVIELNKGESVQPLRPRSIPLRREEEDRTAPHVEAEGFTLKDAVKVKLTDDVKTEQPTPEESKLHYENGCKVKDGEYTYKCRYQCTECGCRSNIYVPHGTDYITCYDCGHEMEVNSVMNIFNKQRDSWNNWYFAGDYRPNFRDVEERQ